jgi:diguanylate cyclase (GGDEF)-like protein/PAS domain S-box-containing protein
MSHFTSSASAREADAVHFSAIFGEAPVAACLVDTEGRVVKANRAFAQSFVGEGSIEEVTLSALFKDFEEDAWRRSKARKGGEPKPEPAWTGETRAPTASTRYVDLYVMPLGHSDALACGYVVIGTSADARHALQASADDAQRSLEETEIYMRASTEASQVALWNICPETGKTWFSDLWYTILGYDPGSFEPSFEVFMDLMHPDDCAGTMAAFKDLVENRTDFYRSDFRLRDAAGRWRWIGATGAKMRKSILSDKQLVCGTQTDITWRKEGEAVLALAAQEALEHRARLDQLADNSPVGLFEFRLKPNGTVEFPYISEGVLDVLGVTREDVEADGSACFRNILPEYLEPLHEAIGLSQAELSPFRIRYRLAHPVRGTIWVQAISLPTRLEDGSTTWHGSIYDVTPEVEKESELQAARDQAIQMQKQMEDLALHDVLTGLPNRRYFDMRLQQQRERVTGSGHRGKLTLIRVDLDHFKHVNDNLGHDAGDAVLAHVAEILRTSIRHADFAARVGGDEFSIILGENGDCRMAREIVSKVQARLAKPFLYGNQICRFGASFGIATCDARKVEDGELHAFADAALYEAKQKGGNRVQVFTEALHRHIIENRRLAAELEVALERGEFEPVFQPQFCARDRQLVGLETLARWRHPQRGMLAPDDFMTVASQIRVVPLIDRMMLEKTRDVLARWREAGFVPPKISFNVSSGRLRDPEILHAARRIRSEGTVVAFELLESILVEDENDAFKFNLDALKDSGIQIEIDDFGSGHASIIGVMEAEPSVLKIDKRLSLNVAVSPQARELVAAIVRISKAFNILTTVEGVESAEQATILTDLGCDILQGFFYAKPLTEDEALEFARKVSVKHG